MAHNCPGLSVPIKVVYWTSICSGMIFSQNYPTHLHILPSYQESLEPSAGNDLHAVVWRRNMYQVGVFGWKKSWRSFLSLLLYLTSTGPYAPAICVCPHRSSWCASECSQMCRAFVKVQIVRTNTLISVTDEYISFFQLQRVLRNLKSYLTLCYYFKINSFC